MKKSTTVSSMKNKLEGTFTLYWTTLRQSLKTALPWIIGVVLLAVSSQAAYENLFPTVEDQRNLAATIQANPAFNLIFGTVDTIMSAEAFTAWRTVVLGSFLVSMMSILLVTKNTRAKEDSGEEELITSSVVGKYAVLTAALAVAITYCVAAGVAVEALLIAIGADVQTSLTLGATLAASGIVFSFVAALTAQLTSSSKTATSFAVTFLGFSYLIRGVADSVESINWMANVSPLGWAQKAEVSAANTIAPLVALLGFGALTGVIAYVLKSNRDFGQGIIADKPGPKRATMNDMVFGLAFRQHKAAIIGWTSAIVLIGSTFSYLLTSASNTFAGNEGFSRFIGADGVTGINFTFEFARTLLTLIGIIVATYGTQIIFRLISEESSHRVEPMLAGSVSRKKMFSSHAIIALVATFAAMVVVGLIMAIIVFVSSTDIEPFEAMVQSLLTAPAMLVLVGISIAITGILPRFRGIAWLAVAVTFGLTLLGPILQLNENVLAISPFWHVANASSDQLNLLSTLVMTLIVSVLVFAGFIGYKRRDIARV